MFSHKYKCIYIHIPKTAGVSIRHFLGMSFKPSDQLYTIPFQPDDHKFNPPQPHLRAEDYLKYGMVTQEEFDSYFKFAFVRNPWERIVSEYKFRGWPQRLDFKTFLSKCLPKPSWTDEYCHIIPQYDFIHDAKGNLLVNFVGRFERLHEDFKVVCQKLGIASSPLTRKNTSGSFFRQRWLKSLGRLAGGGNNLNMCEHPWQTPRGLRLITEKMIYLLSIRRRRNTFPHYTEYYDDESREFVALLYQKDIKTFGYKFDE